MKKIFRMFIIAMCFVTFGLSLAGCGEKTFDDVPWGSTELTSSGILTSLADARTNMEDSKLQTKYKATTTYNFFDAGEFTNMQVREESVFSFQFGTRDTNSIIETSKYIDNVLQEKITDIYVANGAISTVYRTLVTYSDGTEQSQTRTKFNASIPPQNIYTKFISIQQDSLSGVLYKNFEEVDYYKLSANSSECNTLMANFKEVRDLQSNPKMFALSDKSTDLLMGYSVEYGISNKNYITHFALNYHLENNQKASQNSFETFLSYSTTVDLEQYGVGVEFPQKPNDRDYN